MIHGFLQKGMKQAEMFLNQLVSPAIRSNVSTESDENQLSLKTQKLIFQYLMYLVYSFFKKLLRL